MSFQIKLICAVALCALAAAEVSAPWWVLYRILPEEVREGANGYEPSFSYEQQLQWGVNSAGDIVDENRFSIAKENGFELEDEDSRRLLRGEGNRNLLGRTASGRTLGKKKKGKDKDEEQDDHPEEPAILRSVSCPTDFPEWDHRLKVCYSNDCDPSIINEDNCHFAWGARTAVNTEEGRVRIQQCPQFCLYSIKTAENGCPIAWDGQVKEFRPLERTDKCFSKNNCSPEEPRLCQKPYCPTIRTRQEVEELRKQGMDVEDSYCYIKEQAPVEEWYFLNSPPLFIRGCEDCGASTVKH